MCGYTIISKISHQLVISTNAQFKAITARNFFVYQVQNYSFFKLIDKLSGLI